MPVSLSVGSGPGRASKCVARATKRSGKLKKIKWAGGRADGLVCRGVGLYANSRMGMVGEMGGGGWGRLSGLEVGRLEGQAGRGEAGRGG